MYDDIDNPAGEPDEELEDIMERHNYWRLKKESQRGHYYIECDSKYNKGQKLYYQEKDKYGDPGFSIYFDNRSLFNKKTAEKILSKLKYNNPRIVKDKEVFDECSDWVNM